MPYPIMVSELIAPAPIEPKSTSASPDPLAARLADILPADTDGRVRAIGELWLAIRPRPMLLPARRHFDPLCVAPRILPYLWLLDVEQSPVPRFRYRLLGTAHVLAMGGDFTGKYLDLAHPNFLSSASREDYLSVAAGSPSYRRGSPTFHTDKSFISMERLALPLAADGVRVDMMLAITVYTRTSQSTRVDAA